MQLVFKYSIPKRSLLLLFVFFGLLHAQTFQNLVPNGSFETYTTCPTTNSQIHLALNWTGATTSSSDYFNSCVTDPFGPNVPHYAGISSSYPAYLLAKEGNAYAGIYTFHNSDYREYLEAKLNDSLIQGNCYYVEFFATNIQYLKYKSNNVAASFSNTFHTLSDPSPLNLSQYITNYGNQVIKDTVKWEKIAGLYQAGANFKYITIGNFKNNANTDTINIYKPGQAPYYTPSYAYVFIDAVSVFSINPTGNLPWQYRDTTIVQGDSVYIGNTMGGNFNPQWFTMGGSYIATNAGIYVKPAATTSYVVNYTVCGTPRSDTLEVKVVTDIKVRENELNKMEFKLYPNPAKDQVEIEMDKQYFLKPMELSIKDMLGRTVKTVGLTFHKQTVNLNEFESGVYLLTLTNAKGEATTKKIIIQK